MRACIASAALLLSASAAVAQVGSSPDVVFTGTFVTLDSAFPHAGAVAVRGGRIIASGSRAHADSAVGRSARHVALDGVALPGFADAHAHPTSLGEQLEIIDLHRLSKPAILSRVRQAAQSLPAGEWIRGAGWDQQFWDSPQFPTARELDSVSGAHPVMLHRIDGHSVWVNSEALRLAHITAAQGDPSGGHIVRDATGAPTGMLVDSAAYLVEHAVPAPSDAVLERQLRRAMMQYAEWGLTSVHDAGEEERAIDLYESLARKGALTIRAYVMVLGPSPSLAKWLERGPEIGAGDGMLTIRSIKLLADGALGSRGAELSAPYSDAPGERGLVLVSENAIDSIIRLAVPRGFQVNIHAIGDAAVHRVLDAFERAGPSARPLRFRVEHASLVRDEDVPRFAQLGVIASMQPVFVGEYSRWAMERVGAERIHWVYRTRDLVNAGALIAAGTDYPSSDVGDAISTLYSMVTRHGADGSPTGGWYPEQRVDVDVALRSMTRAPAYAAFQERDLGALTVGRYADFTVLSADPTRIAPDSLRSLRVLATVVGGRVVYRAK